MKHLNTKKTLIGSLVTLATLVVLYGFTKTDLYAQGAAIIVAAGDIVPASTGGAHVQTSNQVIQINPAAVLALGDNQYPSGTLATFNQYYNTSWGRFKAKTKPVPGNHEYQTSGASGYYDYFGALAGERGKGYYSYNVGAWHMIALNSEADTGASGAQVQWLTADLNANRNTCTLAYWHTPRWSSGEHGSSTRTAPFIDKLYQAKADIVLTGHDHTYERFAPQNAGGQAAADGIREFVVGTGGAGLYAWSGNAANSQYKQNTAHGVLKLTLNATSYDWQFISTNNQVMDSGTANCVGGGTVPTTSTGPTTTRVPSITGGRIPGNCNNDTVVNVQDYVLLSKTFLKVPGNAGYNASCNFDNQAVIDLSDYAIMSSNWTRL